MRNSSVRLSVKCMNCDITKKTSANILTPYERSIILVFRQEEWWVETTLFSWNVGPNWICRYRVIPHQSLALVPALSPSNLSPQTVHKNSRKARVSHLQRILKPTAIVAVFNAQQCRTIESLHVSHRSSMHLQCVSKNIPDVFSYNSRKHCRIFIIFGRNISGKVSNQTMLYFSTTPH